jgi:tRNA-dihydrouridine synthase A
MFGTPAPSRETVVLAMANYIRAYLARDAEAQVRHVVRHMLGLFHGLPAARAWRRTLSDARLLQGATEDLLAQALDAMRHAAGQGRPQSILPGFIKPLGSSAALI